MDKKYRSGLTKDPVSFALGRITSNTTLFPNFRFNRINPANYQLIDIHSLNDVDAGTRRATLRANVGAEASGEVNIEWSCISMSDLNAALGDFPRPLKEGDGTTVQELLDHINEVLGCNITGDDVVAISGGATPSELPLTHVIPRVGEFRVIKLRAKSTSAFLTGEAVFSFRNALPAFKYTGGGAVTLNAVDYEGYVVGVNGATDIGLAASGFDFRDPNDDEFARFRFSVEMSPWHPEAAVAGVLRILEGSTVRIILRDALANDFPYEIFFRSALSDGTPDPDYPENNRAVRADTTPPVVMQQNNGRFMYKDYTFNGTQPRSMNNIILFTGIERWDYEPTTLTLNTAVYENELIVLQDTQFSFTGESFDVDGTTVIGKRFAKADAPAFEYRLGSGEIISGKVSAIWDIPGGNADLNTSLRVQFFKENGSLEWQWLPSNVFIDGVEIVRDQMNPAPTSQGSGDYAGITLHTAKFYITSGKSLTFGVGETCEVAFGRLE